MTDYTIGTNEQGKTVLYTNHKTDGENYGDYVEVPEGSSIEYAEHVYCNVWKSAKAFCEKAGAGLHRIRMIVNLHRCDHKIRKEEGLPHADIGLPFPVMTIGWTLYLTNEEKARLSKEDIASIAGGIFVEEE